MSNQQSVSSRNIPLPIKREVRRRCGFGCVVCGVPLYEYEHLLGWANVRRHVAKEITLLCDKHHREKTSGLLPLISVTEANSDPFNLRSGASAPYDLHYFGNTCVTDIGSNIFSFEHFGQAITSPICIDGNRLVAFTLDDGHLFLNLLLFDEFNSLILHISDNQLLYSASPWDIELIGQTLIVRDAPRKILIEIRFDVPNRIVISRGRFQCNGVEIVVSPDEVVVTNINLSVSSSFFANCSGGVVIGPSGPSAGIAIRIADVPRNFEDTAQIRHWAGEFNLAAGG